MRSRRYPSRVADLTTVLVGLFVATQAQAQGTAEQRKACTPDALQYCSDAIPDVDRVKACMQKNYSKLSPACQAVFPAGDTAQAKPAPNGEAKPAPRGDSRADAQERAARAIASDPALAVTRQIITGVGQACDNGTMPKEVCGAYNQFLGTVGR